MESREIVLRARKTRPEKAGKQPILFELKRVGVIPRAEKALKIQDFLSVDTTRGNDLAT